MIESITHQSVNHIGGNVMALACMTANKTSLLTEVEG